MGKFLGKLFKSNKKLDNVYEFTENSICETYGSFEKNDDKFDQNLIDKSNDSFFVLESENKLEDIEELLIEKALGNLDDSDEFELKDSTYDEKSSSKSTINVYKPSKINKFLNQDIQEIRNKNTAFVDPFFPPSLKSITDNLSSELGNTLCQSLRVHNRFNNSEINSRLLWKKPQIISYHRRNGKVEFVLDSKGRGLAQNPSDEQYLNCFSVEDVFQGILGDCFMIAAILGITHNKELMAYITPKDNALKKNIKCGAYHFRLWKLGEWFDVVVDEYLIVDTQYNLLFTRNLTCPNEYWICLLEKAVAKFVGRFDILNGGFMENAALIFSGGIQDIYFSDISKFVSNRSHQMISNQASQSFNILQQVYKNVHSIYPNVDELYFIFQQAIKAKNLIGVHSNNAITTQYGVYKGHQYAVTDVFTVNNMKILKVHNPHNVPDKIKYTQNYQAFEHRLTKSGARPTFKGEFYMIYEDLLKCFEIICIYNLLPEKAISSKLPNQTLFTQWKILNVKGKMSMNHNRGLVFKVEIDIKSQPNESMIITHVQNYSKEVYLVNLNLYKYTNNNMHLVGTYRTPFYATQQVYQVNLEAGKYICSFEATTVIKKDPDCLVRIFFGKKL